MAMAMYACAHAVLLAYCDHNIEKQCRMNPVDQNVLLGLERREREPWRSEPGIPLHIDLNGYELTQLEVVDSLF